MPRCAAIATVGVAIALVAACGGSGGSDESTSAAAAVESSTTSAPASTSTTVARQPCTPGHLAEASAVDYPSSTVVDVTCSSAFAVATLQSGRLQGGVGIAYFGSTPEGGWALLKVAPVTSDPNADLPVGIPAGLPNGWRSRYDARVSAPAAPTGGVADGDYQPWVDPPTTLPPPPPPTEPPPIELPAEVPPAEVPPPEG